MFQQVLEPFGTVPGSTLLALVPVAVLLFLLAAVRLSAWQAVIIGSAVTVLLGVLVWQAPIGQALSAYGLGAATGVWSVDWIVFWGVIIYNTLVRTGAFDDFKSWLIHQATADIRVQALLMAWSFGALMEGLVGFGYPWAVVAPILIGLGVFDLAAIRVAAIANNAPVSFGALGAPIIGLAAVTGLPLMELSGAIGRIVAILAIAPPFILIYLVSGKRGLRDGWPLAIVAAFGYIVGQFPIAEFVGPYLPDIVGALTSFAAILLMLRIWKPRRMLGFGGRELSDDEARGGAAGSEERRPTGRRVSRALIPFGILVVVVILWTGPWSPLPKYVPFAPSVPFISSLTGDQGTSSWSFAPFIAGTAILASWLLILAFLRPGLRQLGPVFRDTFQQMWGALLVGPFIFGLAYVFNFSGMANSMANGFSKVGTVYVVLAAILGWIAVALSGSNTSSNAVFGQFQYSVAKLLGAPVLLFPALNSVGAEVGKPIAPQTASVGVATTKFVRNEGEVIRYNMPWTIIVLVYLIGIGCLYFFLFPDAMRL
ncbi:MAG: L-lactate permease [Streptosporangiales bacterium]